MSWTRAEVLDAATAAFTFAAVVVALFIALRQESKSKKDALARARLGAAAMSYRLQRTCDVVTSCMTRTIFNNLTVSQEVSDIQGLAEIRKALKKDVFTPTAEQLAELIPLGNACAHRIARAYDYIGSVRLQAEGLGGKLTAEALDANARRYYMDEWRGALNAASELLTIAVRDCVAATELGAPRPSGQELHGDYHDDE